MRGTDTVGTGVTATDDKDFLALAGHGFGLGEFLAGKNPVLLRQKFQGKVNAFEFASRSIEVTGLRSSCSYHIGVEAFRKGIDIYR